MSDTEFNKLWRRVAEDHAGIDTDPKDLHNARVRTLLCEIKERMDRLTEQDAPPPGDGALREAIEMIEKLAEEYNFIDSHIDKAIALIDAALGHISSLTILS
jgi:hypothetical protein